MKFWRQVEHQFGIVRGIAVRGKPSAVLHFSGGIGDQLLLTCPARELVKRGLGKVWVSSSFPELFGGNCDVDHVIAELPRGARRLFRVLGGRVVSPSYAPHIFSEKRDRPPSKHLLAVMCEQAGIRGRISLRPYFSLHTDELSKGRYFDHQVVVQNTGRSAKHSMLTKEWFPERFQEVVNRIDGAANFIQLGHPSDPAIAGALDLRGKTTIRESAAILANSSLFLGLVGFLMHLARSVDCPSVIVYGGRELPEQSGYVCNSNITGRTPCSPCWRYDTCAGDRACMDQISVDAVASEVSRRLANGSQPLSVEEYEL